MSRLHALVWGIRIAAACALAGFGVFLLVRAWGLPLDGSAATFTPVAFVGALLSFASAVSLVVPHHVAPPRRGNPAAR